MKKKAAYVQMYSKRIIKIQVSPLQLTICSSYFNVVNMCVCMFDYISNWLLCWMNLIQCGRCQKVQNLHMKSFIGGINCQSTNEGVSTRCWCWEQPFHSLLLLYIYIDRGKKQIVGLLVTGRCYGQTIKWVSFQYSL